MIRICKWGELYLSREGNVNDIAVGINYRRPEMSVVAAMYRLQLLQVTRSVNIGMNSAVVDFSQHEI